MAESEVEKSYGRCALNSKFIDRFYEIFLKSHPDIGPMFKNTDFVKQKVALRSGVATMLMLDSGKAMAKVTLDRIAATHSQKGNLKIPHKLYPYWIDSLLATVKECDPEFKPALELQWRSALQKGVDYIISHG
ncbi:MAG: globin [Nitrospirae bacterium]|nr:MAG: globin [Nitrospirota bacterium]